MAAKRALVVVDVQNDFLPGGALGITEGDRVVPKINEYIHRFRAAGLPVVVTRDWHPPVTKHFNNQGGPWPPHCVQGTSGAEFSAQLALPDSVIIVSKGMHPEEDSYSAFHARDGNGRDFESILRELGVEDLFICGLATDYCVRYTGRDALQRGFAVTILVDGVRGVDDEASRQALEELRKEGAKLATLLTLDRQLGSGSFQ